MATLHRAHLKIENSWECYVESLTRRIVDIDDYFFGSFYLSFYFNFVICVNEILFKSSAWVSRFYICSNILFRFHLVPVLNFKSIHLFRCMPICSWNVKFNVFMHINNHLSYTVLIAKILASVLLITTSVGLVQSENCHHNSPSAISSSGKKGGTTKKVRPAPHMLVVTFNPVKLYYFCVF